jgi:hypothetical protein
MKTTAREARRGFQVIISRNTARHGASRRGSEFKTSSQKMARRAAPCHFLWVLFFIFPVQKMKLKWALVVTLCIFVSACLITIIVLQLVTTGDRCLTHAIDVATFGDSMTDDFAYGKQISCASWNAFGYQQYIYRALLSEGAINAVIRNFGIGGQTSAQVAARVTPELRTDYLTFLMGTNDLWTWTPVSKKDAAARAARGGVFCAILF